eukprot:764292-Hanusia_phi.AAC.2
MSRLEGLMRGVGAQFCSRIKEATRRFLDSGAGGGRDVGGDIVRGDPFDHRRRRSLSGHWNGAACTMPRPG